MQREYLTFKCASGLKAGRFVTVDAGTDTVSYATAGGAADAVTVTDETGGVIAVQMLSDTSKSFWFEAEGNISLGDAIEVGTDGKGTLHSAGTQVCVAKSKGTDGTLVTGYNK